VLIAGNPTHVLTSADGKFFVVAQKNPDGSGQVDFLDKNGNFLKVASTPGPVTSVTMTDDGRRIIVVSQAPDGTSHLAFYDQNGNLETAFDR
jgi:hypothetical protein